METQQQQPHTTPSSDESEAIVKDEDGVDVVDGVDGEDEEDEEEDSNFARSDYWERFNSEGELDFYDWYSSEEILFDNIKRFAPDPKTHKVVDIGTGTCPLLFKLAREASYTHLFGMDFSAKAIEFLDETAKVENLPIDYRVMDATDMSAYMPFVPFNIVLDKGCMDCFVNGDGRDKIPSYLSQVQLLLGGPTPAGQPVTNHFLLIEVADVDVDYLLYTGRHRRDLSPYVLATRGARRRETAARREREGGVPVPVVEEKGYDDDTEEATAGDNTPYFIVEQIRARAEKHLHICRVYNPETDKDKSYKQLQVQRIVCDYCNRAYDRATLPPTCGGCSNRLHRFFMS